MAFFHSMKWKVVWPILIMVTLIVFIMSFIMYTYTQKHLEEQGMAITETARFTVENALTARTYSEQILEKEMVGQSVMLALLANKGTNYDELVQLAKRSSIDEFWLTDENGNTVLTNMAPKVEFNFGSDPEGQAYEFMDLINGKRDVVTQPAQIRTVDDQVFKFVGVTGWNEPQIVQVGRNGKALTELEEQIGVQAILNNMQKELGDQVLLAGVVSKQGEVQTASRKEGIPNNILKTFSSIRNEQDITYQPIEFADRKAMVYSSPLSNGTYLMVVLSNEILDGLAKITYGASISAILLFILLVPAIVKRQLHHMDDITRSLAQISKGEGDLTVRLDASGRDEMSKLAHAFNGMMEKMQTIMRQVKSTGEYVAASSEQLLHSAKQGKEDSEQISGHIHAVAQSSSTQYTSSAHASTMIQDMMTAIQSIASSSTTVADLTVDAAQKSQLGDQSLTAVTSQMKHIEQTVEESSQSVQSLDQGAQEISKIVGLITGIAEQTNLLALNASIEAARAGEHGKGFAVVAGEVRNLAEQTQRALGQITSLIQSNKNKSKESLQKMQIVADEVNEGMTMIARIGSYFADIYQSVHEVTAKVQDFTATTEEMSAGSIEVNDSLAAMTRTAEASAKQTEEMASFTERQLAVIQRIASSAQESTEQTEALIKIINRFKVD